MGEGEGANEEGYIEPTEPASKRDTKMQSMFCSSVMTRPNTRRISTTWPKLWNSLATQIKPRKPLQNLRLSRGSKVSVQTTPTAN